MDKDLITLCKELLDLKRQLQRAEIEKYQLSQKKRQLENILYLKMKAQNLKSLNLTDVAQFLASEQIIARVSNFELAEEFLKEHDLLIAAAKLSELNKLVKKYIDEKTPLPKGIEYIVRNIIKVRKVSDL